MHRWDRFQVARFDYYAPIACLLWAIVDTVIYQTLASSTSDQSCDFLDTYMFGMIITLFTLGSFPIVAFYVYEKRRSYRCFQLSYFVSVIALLFLVMWTIMGSIRVWPCNNTGSTLYKLCISNLLIAYISPGLGCICFVCFYGFIKWLEAGLQGM